MGGDEFLALMSGMKFICNMSSYDFDKTADKTNPSTIC